MAGREFVLHPGHGTAEIGEAARCAGLRVRLPGDLGIGMANSRMKDYFDLRALAKEGAVDPPTLAQAIAATFARRGTPLPTGLRLGLSDEFAEDRVKLAQ